MTTLVRHFRQTVIWPLQLMPIRVGERTVEAWQALEATEGANPWRESRDEFCAPEDFQERHYSEFVTFLPYVQRFLYGEGKERGTPASESPIRVFRRGDVARAHDVPRRRGEPGGVRRRARRPVLLLRHRRRHPRGRDPCPRPEPGACAGHPVPLRPHLPHLLERRRLGRPLRAAHRVALGRGRGARGLRLRAARQVSRRGVQLSRARLRRALGVPAAAAGAAPLGREGADPLPRRRHRC